MNTIPLTIAFLITSGILTTALLYWRHRAIKAESKVRQLQQIDFLQQFLIQHQA